VLPLPGLCKELPPHTRSGQWEERREEPAKGSRRNWEPGVVAQGTLGDGDGDRAAQHGQDYDQGREPPGWATVTACGRFSFLKLELTI